MPRVRTCKLCHREAIKAGYCMDHQACGKEMRTKDVAGWATRQGKKVRAAYLSENPYCKDCQTVFGRAVPATEVHHLVPQIDRPDLVYEWSNLIALCHQCHNNRHGKGAFREK